MIQPTQDNEVRIAPAKPRKRRNLPMQITMPPDERARLAKFVRDIGRPTSWVVREAVRMYLDLAEIKVAELRNKLEAANYEDIAAGEPVPQSKIGRPRKTAA
jgi:predicted transcriptional regulator